MNPRQIFLAYATERRAQAIHGFRLEVLPHLSRYTAMQGGMEGFVAFTDLPPGGALQRVREQVAYFAARGESFEWKVYDFDRPASLRSVLEEDGFIAEHTEAFMVLPLNRDHAPVHRSVGRWGLRTRRTSTAGSALEQAVEPYMEIARRRCGP